MLNTHLENSFHSVTKQSTTEVNPLGTLVNKLRVWGGYICELIHIPQTL